MYEVITYISDQEPCIFDRHDAGYILVLHLWSNTIAFDCYVWNLKRGT